VYLLLPNLWKASHTISTSTSVDVQQWPPYSANNLHSYVVTCPSPWFFHLGEEIIIARTYRASIVDTPVSIILHDNARARTADAVKDPLRRWRWEIQEHPPYSPDMSPCDYDLFGKMEETLWETRYSTRVEIIRAVGRSLLDMRGDGRYSMWGSPSVLHVEITFRFSIWHQCTEVLLTLHNLT
jgi:hypothetical protein